MLICNFPGCDMLHGHGGPHQAWRHASQSYAPLAEQRTPAESRRSRADRRERAEQIARDALTQRGYNSTRNLPYADALSIATAAALQALTETENAR